MADNLLNFVDVTSTDIPLAGARRDVVGPLCTSTRSNEFLIEISLPVAEVAPGRLMLDWRARFLNLKYDIGIYIDLHDVATAWQVDLFGGGERCS